MVQIVNWTEEAFRRFILPDFVLYVAVLSIAIVVTSVYPPTTWLRPFLGSVLLWSSIGFVLSIVIYALLLIASANLLDKWSQQKATIAGGITFAVLVFFGPSVAAMSGVVGGAAFGLKRRLASKRGALEQ